MNQDKIMQQIKENNIKPISRGYFIFVRVLVYILFVIVTVLGALFFATAFFKTLFLDFTNWSYVDSSLPAYIVNALPFAWFVLFVLFIFLIPFILRKTQTGYRYSRVLVIVLSLLGSIILGLVFVRIFFTNNELGQSFARDYVMEWSVPNSGRLAGEVVFKDSQKEFVVLRSFDNNYWDINTNSLLPASQEILNQNKYIRIVGALKDEDSFIACQILPLDIDPTSYDLTIDKIESGGSVDTPKTIEDICSFVLGTK